MANVKVSARTALLPGGAPVAGVNIALYATVAPYAKLTSAFTAANGEAALGDRPVGTYEIYVTTNAGQVSESGNRITVTVVDANPHVFDVIINTSALPTATDAKFCRCSGYVVDLFGRPVPYATVVFSESAIPNLLYSAGTGTSRVVSPKLLTADADSAGWLSVDLLKNATYAVTFSGYENATWTITVPNLSSSSLPDVLFPVISGVYYSNSGVTLSPSSAPTLSMSVGQEKELVITTQYLSGLQISSTKDVSFTSSDENKLVVLLTDTSITLQAIAAGVVTVGVSRREEKETQASIFDAPSVWGTLSVTVS
jgi:hypothetical protein